MWLAVGRRREKRERAGDEGIDGRDRSCYANVLLRTNNVGNGTRTLVGTVIVYTNHKVIGTTEHNSPHSKIRKKGWKNVQEGWWMP